MPYFLTSHRASPVSSAAEQGRVSPWWAAQPADRRHRARALLAARKDKAILLHSCSGSWDGGSKCPVRRCPLQHLSVPGVTKLIVWCLITAGHSVRRGPQEQPIFPVESWRPSRLFPYRLGYSPLPSTCAAPTGRYVVVVRPSQAPSFIIGCLRAIDTREAAEAGRRAGACSGGSTAGSPGDRRPS